MRAKRLFIRNFEAAEYFETFLVAAVTSILIIRGYLELTGYPQIGNSTLHIAHMLWGGLLMMVAIIVLLLFLNKKAYQLAAFLGGVGFGMFVDEVGKFVTQDNDYFFKPAVAIMYVVFILIYLGFHYIHSRRTYSPQEYLMNALRGMEEVAVYDLDKEEKDRIVRFLNECDPHLPLVTKLKDVVQQTTLVKAPPPGIYSRFKNMRKNLYLKFASTEWFPPILIAFFLFQLIAKVLNAVVVIFFKGLGWEQIMRIKILQRIGSRLNDLSLVDWFELGSTFLSGFFVLLGIIFIYRSRIIAYRMFERSILVSIFLTQVFTFYREEFAALMGLIFNLLILIALRFMIQREKLKPVG